MSIEDNQQLHEKIPVTGINAIRRAQHSAIEEKAYEDNQRLSLTQKEHKNSEEEEPTPQTKKQDKMESSEPEAKETGDIEKKIASLTKRAEDNQKTARRTSQTLAEVKNLLDSEEEISVEKLREILEKRQPDIEKSLKESDEGHDLLKKQLEGPTQLLEAYLELSEDEEKSNQAKGFEFYKDNLSVDEMEALANKLENMSSDKDRLRHILKLGEDFAEDTVGKYMVRYPNLRDALTDLDSKLSKKDEEIESLQKRLDILTSTNRKLKQDSIVDEDDHPAYQRKLNKAGSSAHNNTSLSRIFGNK